MSSDEAIIYRKNKKKARSISYLEYKRQFETKKFSKPDLKITALETALEIRKLEIELYWKRTTYFWTLIAAALAGYFAVKNIDGNSTEEAFWSFLIGCVGLIFSIAWFFANKGSKQWQENWENHVDLLEDDVIGPLYKTVITRPKYDNKWFYPKGVWDRFWMFVAGEPGPFSVSKINQMVSLYMIFLWFILLIKEIMDTVIIVLTWFGKNELAISISKVEGMESIIKLIIIIITLILPFIIYCTGRTDTNNQFDLTAKQRETTINDPDKKKPLNKSLNTSKSLLNFFPPPPPPIIP